MTAHDLEVVTTVVYKEAYRLMKLQDLNKPMPDESDKTTPSNSKLNNRMIYENLMLPKETGLPGFSEIDPKIKKGLRKSAVTKLRDQLDQ